MSSVTGVRRRKMTEPREPGRSRFVRINPLPSKSHEFADQWSTPVVQFDRSTYWPRDKNRRFNVPTADQHANAGFPQRRNIFFFSFPHCFFRKQPSFKLMKRKLSEERSIWHSFVLKFLKRERNELFFHTYTLFPTNSGINILSFAIYNDDNS